MKIACTIDGLSLPRLPRSSLHLEGISYDIRTLFLFAKSDYHTVFVPTIIFACVAAPVRSLAHLALGVAWTWIHLLQCNISNQYKSVVEDAPNKPWRPIPSGRITAEQASMLHAIVCGLCLMSSALGGRELLVVSLTLTVTTIMYDNARISAHWLQRTICVVNAYAIFEYGATKVMGGMSFLDSIAWISIGLSLAAIGTTAHVADFRDVSGETSIPADLRSRSRSPQARA